MPKKSSKRDKNREASKKGKCGSRHGKSLKDARRKLPWDGLKATSKKICRGRLTVDSNAQGGIFLKGLRSQFTERNALNDENRARRDEDLCRLIDCGLSKSRKKPNTMFDEHGNVNQQYSFFRGPTNSQDKENPISLFSGENPLRVVKGEEIARQSASPSSLLRSPEVVSPGFRLPQHHFLHSELRERPSLPLLLPSPEMGHREMLSPLPSLHAPLIMENHSSDRGEISAFTFGRFESSEANSRFNPTVHSTPRHSPSAVTHRNEDDYLNFQEGLDRVLHDFSNIILTDNELDDRQQLCQYYVRRLRSIEDDS